MTLELPMNESIEVSKPQYDIFSSKLGGALFHRSENNRFFIKLFSKTYNHHILNVFKYNPSDLTSRFIN